MNNMWINCILNAINIVNDKNSNLLEKVVNDYNNESFDYNDYYKVVWAIVEPFKLEGNESLEKELYYERMENEGPSFIIPILDGVENSHLWIKLIDILNIEGY
jgi:hypothetical protein